MLMIVPRHGAAQLRRLASGLVFYNWTSSEFGNGVSKKGDVIGDRRHVVDSEEVNELKLGLSFKLITGKTNPEQAESKDTGD